MKRISFFVVLLIIIGFVVILLKNISSTENHIPLAPSVLPTTTKTSWEISTGAIPNIPFHLPPGFTIHVFASGLGNPRDLQFTPGGTLLVSNPTNNQVTALPDTNHDGVADTEKVIINGENRAHGLAFYNNKLYVADVDKVVRYNWDENTEQATKDTVLFSLPGNNDHNSRTITFNQLGQMFLSLGSTCNVCDESPQEGGSELISDANGTAPRIFATGLRNASFITMNPKTNELWGTEMGRDNLGDNIPPDEINIIRQGSNYGWPFCYGDKLHDGQFDPMNLHSCTNTLAPIYQVPAHSAPLGLTFITSPQFPADWQGDLFVAYHGDWNRSTPSGYKVVHLKVSGNTIVSSEDFLTGFLLGDTKDSSAGRPVDLTFDQSGNLYLSDDKAGNIYIIQKEQ